MSNDDLQPLLNKIQSEGIEKARTEGDAMLVKAKEQANAIVEKARQDAEARIQNAKVEAEAFENRARESLRQAARDLILSIEQQLTTRIQHLLRSETARVMSDDAVTGLIVGAIQKNLESQDEASAVEVLLSPDSAEKLRDHLLGKLREQLGDRPVTVDADGGLQNGFRLRLADGRIEHDFSAEAIADTLGRILRPGLAELLRPEAE